MNSLILILHKMPTFILFQIQIRICFNLFDFLCLERLLLDSSAILPCLPASSSAGRFRISEEQWPCIACWLRSVSWPGFTDTTIDICVMYCSEHLGSTFFVIHHSLIYFFFFKFESNFGVGFVSTGKVEW